MTYKRRWAGVLAVCLAVAVLAEPAAAQTTKLEKAREVVRISHADGTAEQIFDATFSQIAAMVQQADPEMPQEVLDIIREETSASLSESMPALLDEMAEIYEQVFTEEELDGMLAFHRSPVGQSLLAKMPQVMDRSMQFTQTWASGAFQDLPHRVQQRLRAEGYKR